MIPPIVNSPAALEELAPPSELDPPPAAAAQDTEQLLPGVGAGQLPWGIELPSESDSGHTEGTHSRLGLLFGMASELRGNLALVRAMALVRMGLPCIMRLFPELYLSI
jgi:hypothetical protein